MRYVMNKPTRFTLPRLLCSGQLKGRLTVVVNVLMMLLLATSLTLQAQPLSTPDDLIERYATIQLTLTGKDKAADKATALAELLQAAKSYRDANPDNAEARISTARISFAYAATQGQSLGALNFAKDARDDLEKAIALNPATQGGLAQGYLGWLYLQVPGWPLAFGDDKKAAAFMQQALAIESSNYANNVYYAQYLVSKKKYQEAKDNLLKASAAVDADLAHPQWRQWQQQTITNLLANITKNK